MVLNSTPIRNKQWILLAATCALLASAAKADEDQLLPLADTHIHYSHDAWTIFPPADAIELLSSAGLKRAFVSSSSDEGTQMLYEAAPDLVVPVLRPYRRRGEISSWMHDPAILDHMRERLARYTYAGIGEFHAYGDDIETDVLQGVIIFARENNLFLHAHSDADAINRIFEHFPEARVLWAHSGFDRPDEIADMFERHPRLWADLGIRSDQATRGKVNEGWRELFLAWPDRITLGTDTYTPERWPYVTEHARYSREWLNDLPEDIAEKVAWKNAEALLQSGEGWPPQAAKNRSSVEREPKAPGCPEEGQLATSHPSIYLDVPDRSAMLNSAFTLSVISCDSEIELLNTDARMPAHGHGMNYKPRIRPREKGNGIDAEGMLLHMPGSWQFSVEYMAKGERGVASADLDVMP